MRISCTVKLSFLWTSSVTKKPFIFLPRRVFCSRKTIFSVSLGVSAIYSCRNCLKRCGVLWFRSKTFSTLSVVSPNKLKYWRQITQRIHPNLTSLSIVPLKIVILIAIDYRFVQYINTNLNYYILYIPAATRLGIFLIFLSANVNTIITKIYTNKLHNSYYFYNIILTTSDSRDLYLTWVLSFPLLLNLPNPNLS